MNRRSIASLPPVNTHSYDDGRGVEAQQNVSYNTTFREACATHKHTHKLFERFEDTTNSLLLACIITTIIILINLLLLILLCSSSS